MAEPTVINPSPKTRFMQSAAAIKVHRELMQNESLLRSIDTALLQYQFLLADRTTDGQSAAANQYKLNGTLEFLHLLKTLGEAPKPMPQSTVTDNLHEPKAAVFAAKQ